MPVPAAILRRLPSHPRHYAKLAAPYLSEAGWAWRHHKGNYLAAIRELMEKYPHEEEIGAASIAIGNVLTRQVLERLRVQHPADWHSWVRYASAPEVQHLLDIAARTGQVMEELLSNFRSRWTQVMFEMTSGHTYAPTLGLAEKLKDTSLAAPKGDEPFLTDDLKLPREPLIYIEIPPEIGFVVPSFISRTGEPKDFPVVGCYVEEAVGVGDIAGYARLPNEPAPGERLWNVFLWGAPLDRYSPTDDALLFFVVRLPRGTTLDAALDLTTRHIEDARTRAPMANVYHAMQSWREIFAWIMNTCLYATSAEGRQLVYERNQAVRDAEERLKTATKAKAKVIREKLKTMRRDPVTILGPNIKTYAEDQAEAEKHAGHPLVWSVTVQGHRRRQPYGPRHSLRKVVWIQPFRKGPPGAPPSPTRKTRLV